MTKRNRLFNPQKISIASSVAILAALAVSPVDVHAEKATDEIEERNVMDESINEKNNIQEKNAEFKTDEELKEKSEKQSANEQEVKTKDNHEAAEDEGLTTDQSDSSDDTEDAESSVPAEDHSLTDMDESKETQKSSSEKDSEREDEILKEGDQGSEVQEFKEDLIAAGFADDWTNPNDYFGQETVQYVENFQRYYDLEVTGEGDTATIEQLETILEHTYDENTANGSSENMEKEAEQEKKTSEIDQNSDEKAPLISTYATQVEDTSLNEGSNNSAVKEFKEALMAAGFATSWTNPNSNYGAETVEYVKEFQAYYGLEMTGVGDEATLSQLDKVLNSPYQLGVSSSEVREIKTQLMHLGFANQWTNPNSNYGPETVKVVENFQSHYGLVVNGIVDEVTYEKIQGLINPPLSNGSSGENITEFKKDLMAAGFATSWTNPNNNYGPETVEYVKEFQAYYGLEVTGEGDEATLKQLDKVLNNPYQLGESSSEI